MSQPLKTSVLGEGGKLVIFIDNDTHLTVILVICMQGKTAIWPLSRLSHINKVAILLNTSLMSLFKQHALLLRIFQ